jgi:hypothetical protein
MNHRDIGLITLNSLLSNPHNAKITSVTNFFGQRLEIVKPNSNLSSKIVGNVT